MGTVADKLDLLLNTKAAIRQSITGKGQTITDTDPFSSYAAKIDAIETGVQLPELEDPGSAANLLAGKQLVDQYGNPLTGTMPQKSAGDLTASGASIIVPAGYYPSQVSKSVATAAHSKPTISRSGGTVTAQHVQSAGYTSGGTATETLTIPTQVGKTVTPTTYAQTAVASGRLTTGAVTVAGDANLAAGNIRQGVSIFGVAGTLQEAPTVNIYTVTVNSYTESYMYIYYCNASPGIQMARLTSYGSSRTLYVANGYLVIVGYTSNIQGSGLTVSQIGGVERAFDCWVSSNGSISIY